MSMHKWARLNCRRPRFFDRHQSTTRECASCRWRLENQSRFPPVDPGELSEARKRLRLAKATSSVRASGSDSVPDSQSATPDSPSPWSSLPSEILDKALALLPLRDIFRARLVCKRWNALIHCPHFQDSSLNSPVRWGPFCLPRVNWKGTGSPKVPWDSYDLVQKKWIVMPPFQFPLTARNSGWSLMAGNGGLASFRSSDGQRIIVCNPMTNRWKELPAGRLDSRVVSVSHMMVDLERRTYKILLAGSAAYKWPDVRCGMVDLYDSTTNTWKTAADLPQDMVVKCGSYCNGEVFILTRRLAPHFGSPFAVLILDLVTLNWRKKPIPIPQGFGNSPHIVSCSDSVYFVGGSSNATRGMPVASIGIFQLKLGKEFEKWEKLCEYKDEKFLRFSGGSYACDAIGGTIYLVTYAYLGWVAAYSIDKASWDVPIRVLSDMKDIFNSKLIFQPNIRAAP